MSKREIAKRLEQEIAVTTDPKTLIELTRQLAKMQPKQRLRRKPVEVKKSNPIPKPTRTGSAVDDLSEEERLNHDVVIRAEEIIREAKRQGLPVPTIEQAVDRAARG